MTPPTPAEREAYVQHLQHTICNLHFEVNKLREKIRVLEEGEDPIEQEVEE